MDLALLSGLVIAFGVAMYVILDGFDLGVGMLSAVIPNEEGERDLLIGSIAPVWDGNETWLVLGGAMLFAAFPLAYSILLPAWYVPLLVFLVALVFRGVAFEFRPRAHRKRVWEFGFAAGSFLAALAQGMMLGSFVEGLELTGTRYEGGTWGWVSAFSVMSGAGVVAGYALLGATWLIYKTEGPLQERCYRAARRLLVAVLAFIVAVSVWTPLAQPAIAARWLSWPNLVYFSPVPLLTGVVAWELRRALDLRRERAPFFYTVALFLLSYAGLAVSTWPFAVPRTLTIWEAASPPTTQLFILVGVLLLLPLVLTYTVHTYRIFRGKASAGYE